MIAQLRADVEGGLLLSQAMARHPKVFNRLYVAMVEAGEAAGILDIVLDRVAFQIEKETQIKRRVKGAMIYPTIVLIFATLVLIGMLLFLVPIFVKIFDAARRRAADADAVRREGVELPAGRLVHHLPADRRRSSASSRWKKTERGRQLGRVQAEAADEDRRHRAEGHDGALLAHALDARRRGRRHHQGARDHRHTAGNWVVEDALAERAHSVSEGVPIAQPLIENPVFPPMVSQMVKIGEETGELDKMLGKIADFYEDEVDASIGALTSIIEPLMMIGVGVMVGIIIISMYLPMFKMLSSIK